LPLVLVFDRRLRLLSSRRRRSLRSLSFIHAGRAAEDDVVVVVVVEGWWVDDP
jgi:hypothetical protein